MSSISRTNVAFFTTGSGRSGSGNFNPATFGARDGLHRIDRDDQQVLRDRWALDNLAKAAGSPVRSASSAAVTRSSSGCAAVRSGVTRFSGIHDRSSKQGACRGTQRLPTGSTNNPAPPVGSNADGNPSRR